MDCFQLSRSGVGTPMVCDPSEWPEDFRDIRMIDSLLRCPICYEFLKCTMMLPQCSHNYCSMCIRRHLSYKQDCPTCQRSTEDTELINNRILDDFVQLFASARAKLLAAARAFPKAAPSSSSHVTDDVIVSEACDSACVGAKLDEQAGQTIGDTFEKASCPTCGKLIGVGKFNIHVDQCSLQDRGRSAGGTALCASPGKRKPIAKLLYHLLKDGEIRLKLKEWGLSTDGDRQTLIQRHQEFCLLYNAECDALAPRPVADLRRQLEKQERQRSAARKAPSQVKMSLLPANSSDSSDVHRKSYVQAHRRQFDLLVQQARQTQQAMTSSLTLSQTAHGDIQTCSSATQSGACRREDEIVDLAVDCKRSGDDCTVVGGAPSRGVRLQSQHQSIAGRSRQKRCSIDAYFMLKVRPGKQPRPPAQSHTRWPAYLQPRSSAHTQVPQPPVQLQPPRPSAATGVATVGSPARHSLEDAFADVDSDEESLFLSIPEPSLQPYLYGGCDAGSSRVCSVTSSQEPVPVVLASDATVAAGESGSSTASLAVDSTLVAGSCQLPVDPSTEVGEHSDRVPGSVLRKRKLSDGDIAVAMWSVQDGRGRMEEPRERAVEMLDSCALADDSDSTCANGETVADSPQQPRHPPC